MRSKHLVVFVLALVACKDKSASSSSEAPHEAAASARSVPAPQPAVTPAEPLPAEFPLPDSKGRKLVRSHKHLTAVVWEYALPDVSASDVMEMVHAGLQAAPWVIRQFESDAGPPYAVHANLGERFYTATIRAAGAGSTLAIRSYPESGPSTLNAPASYPAKFPFLAGGTASHAPVGDKLSIAYQTDPRDIESGMIVAAEAAGWRCDGTGTVTCTKDKASVTFTTEAAPGGSLLVVNVR